MDNELFDDLDGYEKGVIARALLKALIKQGRFEEGPSLPKPEIAIPIEQYQMKLLSLFVDGETTHRQRIIKELCQLK